jgi:hypothetical protein
MCKIVSELRRELKHLRKDNADLKLQLQHIGQAPAHVSVIQTQVMSSNATHNASTNSYRDVLSSRGGNPAATVAPTVVSLVNRGNSADEGKMIRFAPSFPVC